jgi:subtilase family serine protease
MRRVLVAAALCSLLVAGVGTSTTSGAISNHPPATRPLPASDVPTLIVAEHQATDAGTVAGATSLSVTFVLRERHENALASLLAAGRTVTAAQWAWMYGPDPEAVALVEQNLRRAGMTPTWSPGDTLLTASGPASSVERTFHVQVHNFVLNGGTHFYGPTSRLTPPPAMAGEVLAVTGATDYRDTQLAATRSAFGLSPSEVADFYDVAPLRKAGLDGSGVTVMFPEWAMPANDVLAAFARKFGLPPFSVTVHHLLGPPQSSTSESAVEAALDLEIVHGLAPGAKELVYEIGDSNRLASAIQTMITQNPHAVLSSSIFNNGCEAEPGASPNAMALSSVDARAAAEGISMFWASGDTGAFGCLEDGNQATQNDISVLSGGNDSPYVTSVGGTSVFEAANGAYYKEAAWGDPLEQWGGGGGISTIFKQPSYQVTSGVAAGSLGGRGMPDVSASADPIVGGWDVFLPTAHGPRETAEGGTSAATPCWAAITALIDEDLTHLGLPAVGFANPALYYFSRHPAGLPATPFHPVTEGSNLRYLATAEWNPATGLGSPDAAHLADDFEWYDQVQH